MKTRSLACARGNDITGWLTSETSSAHQSKVTTGCVQQGKAVWTAQRAPKTTETHETLSQHRLLQCWNIIQLYPSFLFRRAFHRPTPWIGLSKKQQTCCARKKKKFSRFTPTRKPRDQTRNFVKRKKKNPLVQQYPLQTTLLFYVLLPFRRQIKDAIRNYRIPPSESASGFRNAQRTIFTAHRAFSVRFLRARLLSSLIIQSRHFTSMMDAQRDTNPFCLPGSKLHRALSVTSTLPSYTGYS